MTDVSDRVRSLLELAEKATPGPWVVHGDGAGEEWVVQEEGPTLDYTNVYDIRLIAEMRNLVPALAQEWEATRAREAELEACVTWLAGIVTLEQLKEAAALFPTVIVARAVSRDGS